MFQNIGNKYEKEDISCTKTSSKLDLHILIHTVSVSTNTAIISVILANNQRLEQSVRKFRSYQQAKQFNM